MASKIDNVIPKPIQGFERLRQEYRILADGSASQMPCKEGASLTPLDLKDMDIAFDPKAHSDFWKPADPKTRYALWKGALEEYSGDLETLLSDRVTYMDKLAEDGRPTIAGAYNSSFEYVAAMAYVFEYGLFHNEALRDASGDDLFRRLGICYIRGNIKLETRVAFSTPGYPHVTILSIQPQRARSQSELLCTEAWTLYYWACKLARRALRTTNHCLPMRLIALCGYEARVVSAVFRFADPRHNAKRMGHGEHQSVKCQIDIEEYRDLRDPKKFWDLMEDMVATPCGNSDVQQKPSGKQST